MNRRLTLSCAAVSQPYPEKDQDVHLIRGAQGLFGVFDGSGKLGDGRAAADACKGIVANHADEDFPLAEILFGAQRVMARMAIDEAIEPGSATTALLVSFDREAREMHYVQVGSGVIGLLRGLSPERLTIPSKQITENSRYVIASQIEGFAITHEGKVSLEPNDRIIIATNGIGQRSLASKEARVGMTSPLECAKFLVDRSCIKDDKTVIVIDVCEVDV